MQTQLGPIDRVHGAREEPWSWHSFVGDHAIRLVQPSRVAILAGILAAAVLATFVAVAH